MQHTILIVDDSAMIRRIVGKILKSYGYEILQAGDGQEGFDVAINKKPHLIIMDIDMPVMNGIDSTRKLKTHPETAHIPVLVLTALGNEEDIKASKDAGCSDFLNKPIYEPELKKTIEKLLQQS